MHTFDQLIHLCVVIQLVTIETRWRPNTCDYKHHTLTRSKECGGRRGEGEEGKGEGGERGGGGGGGRGEEEEERRGEG